MRSRQLIVCCLAVLPWGCAKDEPPPPTPQAPQAAPAQAEPSDEAEKLPSSAAEEPEATGVPGAGLPKSTGNAEPKPQDGLKQDKRKSGAAFKDLASAEQAFKAADLELVQLFGSSATALSEGDGRCERACQAFSSLERAADGICRLAGDSDQRCSKARSRVKEHAGRLKACECK